MKIFIVRLNPDPRKCRPYSKYPNIDEYKEIHENSPMDGFHEAVNFLSEKGIVRGYLPPRHSRALRDGEPFILITITAKTAKVGGDKIMGIQAGCIYSDSNIRKGGTFESQSLGLSWHYYCPESMSILFEKPIDNARNILLSKIENQKWIYGPTFQVEKNNFLKAIKHIEENIQHAPEKDKLRIIKNAIDAETLLINYELESESNFENDIKGQLDKNLDTVAGNKYPQQKQILSFQYVRDPAVVAYTLKNAQGKCGDCGNLGPFLSKNTGLPYLEVHHKIMLKDGGEDTPENTIALCPNCHRKRHYG